jgi:hypothetical protein
MGQPVEVRVLSRAALVDICEAFFKDNAYGEGVPLPFRGGFVREQVFP